MIARSALLCATIFAALITVDNATSQVPGAHHSLGLEAQSIEPIGTRVAIPAGFFESGTSESERAAIVRLCRQTTPELIARIACTAELFILESPRRRVYLPAFAIDRFEVTNARYDACVAASFCAPSPIDLIDTRFSQANHPVTRVTLHDAQRFCEWAGGRLPSDREWERAARGELSRRFPWGNFFNPQVANYGTGLEGDEADGALHVAPVGSYRDGVSPDGLYDMSGNVWEWVDDTWDMELGRTGRASGRQIVRGGSWRSFPVSLRGSARSVVGENTRQADLGFRCAYGTAN